MSGTNPFGAYNMDLHAGPTFGTGGGTGCLAALVREQALPELIKHALAKPDNCSDPAALELARDTVLGRLHCVNQAGILRIC